MELDAHLNDKAVARKHPRKIEVAAYITGCKLCPYPVYTDQAHQWARDPMGISHTECLTTAKAG